MRAVIQRVKSAEVKVQKEVKGKIDTGLVVLLGVEDGDSVSDAEYLSAKILKLRIFEDEKGKMNLNVDNVNGAILVVSQFTLLGDCRKGNRPSFDSAAPPVTASRLYSEFVAMLKKSGLRISEGVFGKYMDVYIYNTGPVTILMDSKKRF